MRVAGDAVGAARKGLVFQHLAAWCAHTPDARLATWRTQGGLEVDFVVECGDMLVAIEVKSGGGLRPADRRGLLAFRDEFPDARLVLLCDAPVREVQGPITIMPIDPWLRALVPGTVLP